MKHLAAVALVLATFSSPMAKANLIGTGGGPRSGIPLSNTVFWSGANDANGDGFKGFISHTGGLPNILLAQFLFGTGSTGRGVLDPSRFTVDFATGDVTWDLTGTGFSLSFVPVISRHVADKPHYAQFSFYHADQPFDTLGSGHVEWGNNVINRIDFFGVQGPFINVPDAGASTAWLLGMSLACFVIARPYRSFRDFRNRPAGNDAQSRVYWLLRTVIFAVVLNLGCLRQ